MDSPFYFSTVKPAGHAVLQAAFVGIVESCSHNRLILAHFRQATGLDLHEPADTSAEGLKRLIGHFADFVATHIWGAEK